MAPHSSHESSTGDRQTALRVRTNSREQPRITAHMRTRSAAHNAGYALSDVSTVEGGHRAATLDIVRISLWSEAVGRRREIPFVVQAQCSIPDWGRQSKPGT